MDGNGLTVMVASGARVSSSTELGPGCVIGDGVEIGANCEFGPYCIVHGPAVIGSGNRFHNFCCIGGDSQDKKAGRGGGLRIGCNNSFREYCTVHRATEVGSETTVGDGNLLMAYSHVAHECAVGNDTVIANFVQLGGHVVVHDKAVFGGGCLVHQYSRIGTLAFVGAGTVLRHDLPPFTSCTLLDDGRRMVAMNKVGLARAGVPASEIKMIDMALRDLYRSTLSIGEAVKKMKGRDAQNRRIAELIRFLDKVDCDRSRQSRGILRPRECSKQDQLNL